jgi:copper chaperone
MTTVDITVPDMACGACADAITQAVHTLDQTATVQADTGTKRVIIQTTAAPPEVTAAITAAGYTVQS